MLSRYRLHAGVARRLKVQARMAGATGSVLQHHSVDGGSNACGSVGVGYDCCRNRRLLTSGSTSATSSSGKQARSSSDRMPASSSSASLAHHARAQSSQAALHQTSAVHAEAIDSHRHSSAESQSHAGYALNSALRRARPGRRLPTPLPPELTEQRSAALRKHLRSRSAALGGVLSQGSMTPMPFGDLTMATLNAINTDASHYTPSHVKENVAILRVCLSTGLIARASKIFNELRQTTSDVASLYQDETAGSTSSAGSESLTTRKTPSVFGLDIYNAMLGAYLRKAWQEEDTARTQSWVDRAWQLFDSMNGRPSPIKNQASVDDPRPTGSTYAVFSKGIVRLMRGNKYARGHRDLSMLLATLRQNSINVEDVFLSSAFSQERAELQDITSAPFSREGEPDARIVLQQMISVAADVGDSAMSIELQKMNRSLQSLERKADAEVRNLNAKDDTSNAEPHVQAAELLPVRGPIKPKTMLKQEFDKGNEVAFNLQVLRENLSIVQQAKRSSTDPYERQKWLEFSAVEAARKRFDYAVAQMEQIGLQNASKMGGKKLQTWMWEWYGKLEKALTVELEKLHKDSLVIDSSNAKASTSPSSTSTPNSTILNSIYPFLRSVPPKKLALITVLEMIRLQNSGGVREGMKTAHALVSVGKLVEAEMHALQIRNKDQYFHSARQIQDELRRSGLSNYHARSRLRLILKRQYDKEGQEEEMSSWTFNIRARVGSFLVQNLMKVAKIRRKAVDRDGVEWSEEQPVFYSAYQYIQGRRLGVIKTNEEVSKQLLTEGAPLDMLQIRHLPMLVPPKSWLTHESGGYYSVKSRALRYKEVVEQGSYIRKASEEGDLDLVFSGLDALGQTPWAINEDVFKVMTVVWNSGKGVAELPPIELGEEEPTKPDDYDTDIRSRAAYLKRMRSFTLRQAACHSQRCDANYKLEVARAYRGERFYFPHNLDFRGRAYPIPPTLNHIGNDLCRGLLRFADAKPLGTSGLRWLRIHLANVYGFDKASFSEREQFSIDHIESIKASARDPLGPEGKWWLQADDPWQCLAACKELTGALEHPQGPEKFASSLPVHQDGTCNGLQHYAALGGDLAGAKQVNLSKGDRPSDVYTGVADMVIDVVDSDASMGKEVAKILQGKITRKVVKQTVMTTVYGVTFIGAKDQVLKQLAARGDISSDQLWTAASYLAKVILSCVGDLFKGADAIKRWLSESAMLIARTIPPGRMEQLRQDAEGGNVKSIPAKSLTKEQMTSVIWTTPLGLPVVQPYRKVVRKQVATTMQTVYLHDPQTSTQVAPAKQASAFPPNYIHSLDATHMFLTALECQEAGLTFASVHDSYWTHACDIGTMNDVIRDTFIRLHSVNLLKRLRDEFLERYEGHVLPVHEARRMLRKYKRGGAKARVGVDTIGSATALSDAEPDADGADAIVAEDGASVVEPEGTDEAGVEEASSLSLSSSAAATAAAAEKAEWANALLERLDSFQGFVPLAEMVSPLPEKGAFNVEEIRQSLYFFS